MLLEGRDADALAALREATASMRRGRRHLYLPTAATYLAEAQWRAGDEEAADRAADLALEASTLLGSPHLLLQALRDFPAVLARRIDAEPDGDSEWHRLGRALHGGVVAGAGVLPAPVHVREFGGLAVLVDGAPTDLRLTKAQVLLAYLAARPDRADRRDRLVEALFAAGTDDSANAYLRQAVHRARAVLPGGVSLLLDRGRVAVTPATALNSDSVRFSALLREAHGLAGRDRYDVVTRAIALAEHGPYLGSIDLPWVNRRRAELATALDDATVEAARLAVGDGAYDVAEELAGRVVQREPLREDAWRVRMRACAMLGDHRAVLRTYRACEAALAEAGAEPAAETRSLLANLRR